MSIPVFHDDQHGTAIISAAALLNALHLAGKELAHSTIVFAGCGAAAISTARFYLLLGARRENIVMCDRDGVVYQGRERGMNPYKAEFASTTTARTLAEALVGADVFVGLASAGILTPQMLEPMAPNPILFALANPDPEISYEDARAARPDAIVATGRSDYPNQVNNVLGFPFIFRGALDVHATRINEEMKVAAARALADLAREDVPDSVARAYGLTHLTFGPEYLIPKPLDSRVLLTLAPAVAQAAIDTGVARRTIDIEAYKVELEGRLGKSREVMRIMFNKAKIDPRRIALAPGENEKVIRAAHQIAAEGIAYPVLIGDESRIREQAVELQIHLDGIEIVNPQNVERRERLARRLYDLRARKGVTWTEAWELAANTDYVAALMLEAGEVQAAISGLRFHYPDVLRPPLQIIKTQPGTHTAAGVFLVTTRNRVLFFADTTVNIEPDAGTLAEIAILTARLARDFDVEPRVAMLSFSNFGSVRHPRTGLIRKAIEIVRERDPDLQIEGEMQVDTALDEVVLNDNYPFNRLRKEANVLIFPSLEAGNIACKLVQQVWAPDGVANADLVGPIMVGMRKPAYVLLRTHEVKDIVNIAAIATVEAQKLAPLRSVAPGEPGAEEMAIPVLSS
jgi:malate dehydrogenase (oxaloacetate-decarboxylating)(NADP+)